jgi:Metallopeptidase family M24
MTRTRHVCARLAEKPQSEAGEANGLELQLPGLLDLVVAEAVVVALVDQPEPRLLVNAPRGVEHVLLRDPTPLPPRVIALDESGHDGRDQGLERLVPSVLLRVERPVPVHDQGQEAPAPVDGGGFPPDQAPATQPADDAAQIAGIEAQVLEEAGFGPGYRCFTHRVGHGIGMGGHEWTYLVRGNTTRLRPGMCFSDEPRIYVPGELGVRHEDIIFITENGAENMTRWSGSPEEPAVVLASRNLP